MKFFKTLVLALSIGSTALWGADPVIWQNNLLTLDFSNFRWNSNPTAQLLKDQLKTPDGEASFGYQIGASAKNIYINGSRDKKMCRSWQKHDVVWQSMSFWLWSDGSDNTLALVFHCVDRNNKPGVTFSYEFKLNHQGWKLYNFKWMWTNQPQERPMHLARLSEISFYLRKPINSAKFRVGPFRIKTTPAPQK